jgi:2-oxoglutarate ferredoxin oxidoreductase subunit alpha
MGHGSATVRKEELVNELPSVVVRIAGDSGDGIQITGSRFTDESALAGNDLATLPDFPAEIRAPAGTIGGVSGFQIHFGSVPVYTPGDQPDVLVAMNPAALKANLADVIKGGTLVLNEDAFNEKNLSKVGYTSNPCEDEALRREYSVQIVPISRLTKDALAETGLSSREVERCKNFFTLGLLSWMYGRNVETTVSWLEKKFKSRPDLAKANILALQAGVTYGEVTESIAQVVVAPAQLEPGVYRNLNGTTGLALGLASAAVKSGRELFFSAYPITPASELLHELARMRAYHVDTIQAEDEIAAICEAIGASFAGRLGITSSSGPGIALKMEGLNLAVMTELPLVVIDVQRAGPSTGLPTKTEQADLLQSFFGRPGEAPLCILAASSPQSAFLMGYEACRIALKYMTPVMLLSDGYIANCSEPWLVPSPEDLPPFEIPIVTENNNPAGAFLPYLRNEKTLARAWALPGTPGLMHRIGGLEKQDRTGNVNYTSDNHEMMVALRAEKIARIVAEIPPIVVDGPESGDVLVIGWGGTEGALIKACQVAREGGAKVSRIHLEYLNPLPADLEAVMSRFKRVLVAEINSGQLRMILRARYLVDAAGFNRIRGLPLKVREIVAAIAEQVEIAKNGN